MHNAAYQYTVLADLIDNTVWETVNYATSRTVGEWGPCLREGEDAVERILDFYCKLISKARKLIVIVVYRFGKLLFCTGENLDPHL